MGLVTVGGVPVDERIAEDARAILDRFPVKFTAGYATSGHAAGGEHPLGLALDIVPDTDRGGTWADVGELARFAEPRQNQPRNPFRWVGYNGDRNHGSGHHLHLSWNHQGRGREVVTGVNLPGGGKDSGGGLPGVTDLAGVAGDAAGAVLGLGGEAAEATAKAIVDLLWDAFGVDGAKILLTVAFVAGGVTLAGIGVARMFGLGEKAGQAVSLIPAARAARAAT